MSELRKDPVVDRWVIIAAARSRRPQALAGPVPSEPAEPCPFCAGRETMTPPEILAYRDPSTAADTPGWRVRVVPNKYPALHPSADFRERADFYRSEVGVGVHEVVIEAPHHCTSAAQLSRHNLEEVLAAYRQRMLELQKDPRWQSILVYKNQGEAAGATLEHVHSQLLAMPVVAREIAAEARALEEHHSAGGGCLYCAVIDKEETSGERIVGIDEVFLAFCPFAARFPFETWIVPKRHSPSFQTMPDRELRQLADSLHQVLQNLDRVARTPLNYVIHSAPLQGSGSQHYHWHLEILPRTSKIAGFELASGYFINTVAPETAARLLRAAS